MSEPAAASIQVSEHGPYAVTGAPVARRRQVEGESGHPHRWETYDDVADGHETVWLCRCGQSQDKPFCDGSHAQAGFDGTEAAPTDAYAERAKVLTGSDNAVTVRDDRGICEHAGFCASRGTNVWKMARRSADSSVREQMIEMIDHCPSGALTYDEQPHPALEVGVVRDGPLYVTGGPQVTRADGQPFESRAHMTLCRCGHSGIKPLCDGSHAEAGFRDG